MDNAEAINVLLHHKEAFELSGKTAESIDLAITALKKQEQGRWIPCKERLPEEYGEYRITWKTSRPEKRLIADAEYEPENEYDAVNREFIGKWLLEDNIRYYPDVEVIAWKPIEEPYTE